MNNSILCFLFCICFSLSIVQAQCDQPILKTILFTNGTEVETSYCGTVNDRGQRDGQGRLEYINHDISYEEGIWKNDQLNGEGKTIYTNGQKVARTPNKAKAAKTAAVCLLALDPRAASRSVPKPGTNRSNRCSRVSWEGKLLRLS